MADAADYIDNVKKYDPNADLAVVTKIVKHCGIALTSKDASLVSCSDKSEKDRVRDGFCAKKLGMDTETAGKAVDAVCEEMKGEKRKSRVTFYYLLAKNAGKLGDL
ncbi:MAG: DUF2853 family protein [Planctomycetes bacterium]|nr:DUF2853 family protein [Planctomycetota bacterium]